MVEVGDRIWWGCIHGPISGIVEKALDNDNYLVRLNNGKSVIVHELSITKWEKP